MAAAGGNTLKLLGSITSPFVRKVRVVAMELGLGDRLELVPTETSDPALGLINPLGKVPALERPDGPALYDSRVICQYLDAEAGAGLYPNGARRWDTLTVEATGDGILDAALLMVYEWRIRPEDMRYAPWVEGQWAKVDRALDVLETRWMAHLDGPLDMGQIAVACALGYLDFRHDARGWRTGRPHLAAWEARFAARPSMQATVPV